MPDGLVHILMSRPGDEDRICCLGAVMNGRCTCWEPEYDLEQQPEVPGLVPQRRTEICADCACRPDSPERRQDEGYSSSWDGVVDLAESGSPFFCHQGMRRYTGERHPDGSYNPAAGADAYAPPTSMSGKPLKADGTPADICAGWAAMRDARRPTEETPR